MKTIADIIHQNKLPLRIIDNKGNTVYWEDIDKLWCKRRFNSKGIRIYFEHSLGYVIDNRP